MFCSHWYYWAAAFSNFQPRLSSIPSVPSCCLHLVGVGVAVGIGGAILETIFPQTLATINLLDIGTGIPPGGSLLLFIGQGLLIILGTVTTLIYSHFGARNRLIGKPRRPEWVEALARVGQIFIAITLGVIFAGVLTASFNHDD